MTTLAAQRAPSPMKFPLDIAELTPELLSQVLGQMYPNVRVRAFDIIQASVHGNGSTSTADRVTLELKFQEGSGEAVPSRLLLKTMLVEPHVPITMYENEVLFYRHIRPHLRIETPQVYGTAFDSGTGQFGILMEDLTCRGARFPQATLSLTREQMQSALDTMADLHAQYWMSPRLSGEWNWLPKVASGGMAEVFKTDGWYQHVAACIASSEVKQKALRDVGKTLPEIWLYLWKILTGPMSQGPKTLIHGDTHIANIYLLADDRVGLIDWQLASRGCWAQDFTYLMMTAMNTDYRRNNERFLLRYYLEGVARRGVAQVPTFDDAFKLYRQSAMWGFAIGWLGCPVENYGPEIMHANVERITAAVVDLETFSAMDS